MKKGERTGFYPPCERCGKPFYVAPARLANGPARFCSHTCYSASGMRKAPKSVLADRFWSKVERRGPEECWPWLASDDGRGYGSINVGGKLKKASRVAYELANGQFDQRLEIRHTCDNPTCCNPAHLIPGTHAQNMADMWERGRANLRVCRGEEVYLAKLDEDAVRQIRAAYSSGGVKLADLGNRYGVTPQAIYAVVTRRNWAHVR